MKNSYKHSDEAGKLKRLYLDDRQQFVRSGGVDSISRPVTSIHYIFYFICIPYDFTCMLIYHSADVSNLKGGYDEVNWYL
jgi:hypothetical protein